MDAVAMLGIGGTAYLIGVHRPGATIEVTPFGDLMAARKNPRRGHGIDEPEGRYSVVRRAVLQWRFKLDEFISSLISLDGIDAGCEALSGGSVARSVITSF